MRFAGYHAFRWFGLKVDWDAAVTITDEVRAALHPHVASELRTGVLRRRFIFEPPENGRRSRRVREGQSHTVHPKGAMVFAREDDAYIWIEVEEDSQ